MKVLNISHISDPDGITPVILSKIAFDQVDSFLFETSEVNSGVLKLINDNILNQYDAVYITDLGLNEDLCNMIENDSYLKSKVKLFDHHIGNKWANRYSFAKVIDEDDNENKQSGTSLYYDYLLHNYTNDYLKKESVRYFVNLVREYDTWEWTKNNNNDAKNMAHLFELYGRDYFEKRYLEFFKVNDDFFFEDKELFLLEIIQREIDNYIEEQKKKVVSGSLLNHEVGIVFASRHRSELGNALAKYFKDKYDFIIIINIERGVSYRGIKDINLSEVANVFGGKGHINSSGSPLPEGIHETIIKMIFNDKIKFN